jgi:hypothetical protein
MPNHDEASKGMWRSVPATAENSSMTVVKDTVRGLLQSFGEQYVSPIVTRVRDEVLLALTPKLDEIKAVVARNPSNVANLLKDRIPPVVQPSNQVVRTTPTVYDPYKDGQWEHKSLHTRVRVVEHVKIKGQLQCTIEYDGGPKGRGWDSMGRKIVTDKHLSNNFSKL